MQANYDAQDVEILKRCKESELSLGMEGIPLARCGNRREEDELRVLSNRHGGSVRFQIVIDLVRRNCNKRVLDVQGRVLSLFRLPDVVQTLAADAASQVCVQLSRG